MWHASCDTENARRNRPDGASRRPRGDAMSMELWYDLAVRELSDLDAQVTELIKDGEMVETARDADARVVVAVDFF